MQILMHLVPDLDQYHGVSGIIQSVASWETLVQHKTLNYALQERY